MQKQISGKLVNKPDNKVYKNSNRNRYRNKKSVKKGQKGQSFRYDQ